MYSSKLGLGTKFWLLVKKGNIISSKKGTLHFRCLRCWLMFFNGQHNEAMPKFKKFKQIKKLFELGIQLRLKMVIGVGVFPFPSF